MIIGIDASFFNYYLVFFILKNLDFTKSVIFLVLKSLVFDEK